MAFFLESTFVGLFFFGRDRLGRVQHLGATFLLALLFGIIDALWPESSFAFSERDQDSLSRLVISSRPSLATQRLVRRVPAPAAPCRGLQETDGLPNLECQHRIVDLAPAS